MTLLIVLFLILLAIVLTMFIMAVLVADDTDRQVEDRKEDDKDCVN